MSPLRTEILATLLEILSDVLSPRTKILARPLVSINCCLSLKQILAVRLFAFRKVYNLIEFFIVKLEQIFVFRGNYWICSSVDILRYWNNPVTFGPRLLYKLVNFLCELMYSYFYWKIYYFGNFLYTAPCQPGGRGQDFIRGAGPPGPTLATALPWRGLSNAHVYSHR